MSFSYKKILYLHSAYSKISNGHKDKLRNLTKIHSAISSKHIHTCNSLAARVSYILSDIGEGIREVVVKEWYVKVGDKVSQFDNICEVQSDKASVTITSRYDGTISKLHYEVDETALVGKPLVDIEADQEESTSVQTSEHVEKPGTAAIQKEIEDNPHNLIPNEVAEDRSQTYTTVLAIPSVRRLAKEHKIQLENIIGTGKGGRITKEDILVFLDNKSSVTRPPILEEDRIEPIKGFQKAMVKTMTESLKIPHFVYSDEIKLTKLSELRRMLKQQPELQDLKMSFMPFFIKAVSNALHRYPILNASVDEICENVIYRKNHNIGVAMDTKVGLAVPVIKNVERLSILEISAELSRLIKSGKDGSFSPSDLTGGTFTVSNIGTIGGTYTKPVILPPQVAIIALGISQLLPRFDESRNVIAEEIVNISAAADHRVVDGATMANFTKILQRQIENPYLLFLNV